MSLIVTAHKIDPQTLNILEDLKVNSEIANDLAGFENWREKLYSSEVIKKIGCELLPELSSKDIFAIEEDLNKLKKDCQLVLNNIRTVCEKTSLDPADVTFRINNILVAIDTALNVKDGAVMIS